MAGRSLVEQVLVRSPRLAGAVKGRALSLPQGALRRRVLQRQVASAFSAMARNDTEVMLLSYEPDAELRIRDMPALGLREAYIGHRGIGEFMGDVEDVFGEWSWTAREVVDAGDRAGIRADFEGVGRASGVRTKIHGGGTAIWISERGLVERQDWFASPDGWRKALTALGLRD